MALYGLYGRRLRVQYHVRMMQKLSYTTIANPIPLPTGHSKLRLVSARCESKLNRFKVHVGILSSGEQQLGETDQGAARAAAAAEIVTRAGDTRRSLSQISNEFHFMVPGKRTDGHRMYRSWQPTLG